MKLLNGVLPLHSTMFLLIQTAEEQRYTHFSNFTFHNVSINTLSWLRRRQLYLSLHSTMFLLIHRVVHTTHIVIVFTFHNVSINTGNWDKETKTYTVTFTFHNVSINTTCFLSGVQRVTTLHSTMFLLIRLGFGNKTSDEPSLHSTMFLLIRERRRGGGIQRTHFTFHNVSINTV